MLDDDVLAGLSERDRAERWRQILGDPDASVLVLDDAERGAVAGFAYLRSAPYADGREDRTGEIDSLNLAPHVWGRGAGRLLLREMLEEARRRRFEEVQLWVFAANARARRFYERAGLHYDGTTVRHQRFQLPLLRYSISLPG